MKKCISRGYMALVTALTIFLAYGIISFAAEGTVQITDVTGNVGEEITIPVSISTAGEPIGDGNLTLNYDSAMLEFVGGDNASGGDGVVSLNASGTGTETTLNYTIVFKCLSEGNTVLQSAGSTAYLFSDAAILAGYADRVLYVVRHDMAEIPQIEKGMESFIQEDKLLGYLINRSQKGFASYGKYGYGKYGYGKYGKYQRYVDVKEDDMDTEDSL